MVELCSIFEADLKPLAQVYDTMRAQYDEAMEDYKGLFANLVQEREQLEIMGKELQQIKMDIEV